MLRKQTGGHKLRNSFAMFSCCYDFLQCVKCEIRFVCQCVLLVCGLNLDHKVGGLGHVVNAYPVSCMGGVFYRIQILAPGICDHNFKFTICGVNLKVACLVILSYLDLEYH